MLNLSEPVVDETTSSAFVIAEPIVDIGSRRTVPPVILLERVINETIPSAVAMDDVAVVDVRCTFPAVTLWDAVIIETRSLTVDVSEPIESSRSTVSPVISLKSAIFETRSMAVDAGWPMMDVDSRETVAPVVLLSRVVGELRPWSIVILPWLLVIRWSAGVPA